VSVIVIVGMGVIVSVIVIVGMGVIVTVIVTVLAAGCVVVGGILPVLVFVIVVVLAHIPLAIRVLVPVHIRVLVSVHIRMLVPVHVRMLVPVHIRMLVPVHIRVLVPVHIRMAMGMRAMMSLCVVMQCTAAIAAALLAPIRGSLRFARSSARVHMACHVVQLGLHVVCHVMYHPALFFLEIQRRDPALEARGSAEEGSRLDPPKFRGEDGRVGIEGGEGLRV
jgi:hypothetical protein